MVLAVALVNGFIGFGVPAIWAAHLHQVQGLSLSAAGAVAACYGLGGSAYMLLAGPLSVRLGESRLAWTGGALQFIYGMGIEAFEQRCGELAAQHGPGFALSAGVTAALRQHQPVY